MRIGYELRSGGSGIVILSNIPPNDTINHTAASRTFASLSLVKLVTSMTSNFFVCLIFFSSDAQQTKNFNKFKIKILDLVITLTHSLTLLSMCAQHSQVKCRVVSGELN